MCLNRKREGQVYTVQTESRGADEVENEIEMMLMMVISLIMFITIFFIIIVQSDMFFSLPNYLQNLSHPYNQFLNHTVILLSLPYFSSLAITSSLLPSLLPPYLCLFHLLIFPLCLSLPMLLYLPGPNPHPRNVSEIKMGFQYGSSR